MLEAFMDACFGPPMDDDDDDSPPVKP